MLWFLRLPQFLRGRKNIACFAGWSAQHYDYNFAVSIAGETAVHIAIVNHDTESVKKLIGECGADIHARAQGRFFLPEDCKDEIIVDTNYNGKFLVKCLQTCGLRRLHGKGFWLSMTFLTSNVPQYIKNQKYRSEQHSIL